MGHMLYRRIHCEVTCSRYLMIVCIGTLGKSRYQMYTVTLQLDMNVELRTTWPLSCQRGWEAAKYI